MAACGDIPGRLAPTGVEPMRLKVGVLAEHWGEHGSHETCATRIGAPKT